MGNRSGIPGISTYKTRYEKIDERIGIPLERLLYFVSYLCRKVYSFHWPEVFATAPLNFNPPVPSQDE